MRCFVFAKVCVYAAGRGTMSALLVEAGWSGCHSLSNDSCGTLFVDFGAADEEEVHGSSPAFTVRPV